MGCAPLFETILSWHVNLREKFKNIRSMFNPLSRYEFGPPTFFSKTLKFSILFYSSWQILGGDQFRKASRSRKKKSKQSEITWKQLEPVRSISNIEKRREFVRALCDAGRRTRFARETRPNFWNFFSELWVLGTCSSNVKVNPVISWNGHNSFQRIFPSSSRNFTSRQPRGLFLYCFLFDKSRLWEILVD